jgi:hypothetical protein
MAAEAARLPAQAGESRGGGPSPAGSPHGVSPDGAASASIRHPASRACDCCVIEAWRTASGTLPLRRHKSPCAHPGHPPNALPQVGQCGAEMIGACALQALAQAPAGDVRRDRDQPMAVVRRPGPWQEVAAGLLALCPDDGPPPCGALTAPHLVALLGEPDAREVDRKRCMGARARGTPAPQATQNLLKRPPQGGGGAPPKRRQ